MNCLFISVAVLLSHCTVELVLSELVRGECSQDQITFHIIKVSDNLKQNPLDMDSVKKK